MIFMYIDYFLQLIRGTFTFFFSFINMYLTQPYQLVSSKILFLKSNNYFFPFFRHIYLRILTTLGLHCFKWAFSRCGEGGLPLLVAHRLLTVGLLLWSAGSRQGTRGFGSCSSWAQQLCCMGLVARWQMGSSWTRDQTLHWQADS